MTMSVGFEQAGPAPATRLDSRARTIRESGQLDTRRKILAASKAGTISKDETFRRLQELRGNPDRNRITVGNLLIADEWRKTGIRFVDSIVPGVWARDWNKLSNTDRAINIAFDLLIVAPLIKALSAPARSAIGVIKATAAPGNRGATKAVGSNLLALQNGLKSSSERVIKSSADEIARNAKTMAAFHRAKAISRNAGTLAKLTKQPAIDDTVNFASALRRNVATSAKALKRGSGRTKTRLDTERGIEEVLRQALRKTAPKKTKVATKVRVQRIPLVSLALKPGSRSTALAKRQTTALATKAPPKFKLKPGLKRKPSKTLKLSTAPARPLVKLTDKAAEARAIKRGAQAAKPKPQPQPKKSPLAVPRRRPSERAQAAPSTGVSPSARSQPAGAIKVAPAAETKPEPSTRQQPAVPRPSTATGGKEPWRPPPKKTTPAPRPSKAATTKKSSTRARLKFELPNNKSLRPGYYPREVAWDQGIIRIHQDLDTGKRRRRKLPRATGKTPRQSLTVTRQDRTPPKAQQFDMGDATVIVTPERLRFRRSASSRRRAFMNRRI